VGSSAVPIIAKPHNVELTLGDFFQTCRRAFNIQHKMLAITLNLFVAIFILFWAYLTITTRHMAKLAKNIPGPKQSPLWKKILTSRNKSKSAGK
jgi:amino acid permease